MSVIRNRCIGRCGAAAAFFPPSFPRHLFSRHRFLPCSHRLRSFGFMFVATTSKNQVTCRICILSLHSDACFPPKTPGTAPSCRLQVLVSDPATPYDVITEVLLHLLLPASGSAFTSLPVPVDDGGVCRGKSCGGMRAPPANHCCPCTPVLPSHVCGGVRWRCWSPCWMSWSQTCRAGSR